MDSEEKIRELLRTLGEVADLEVELSTPNDFVDKKLLVEKILQILGKNLELKPVLENGFVAMDAIMNSASSSEACNIVSSVVLELLVKAMQEHSIDETIQVHGLEILGSLSLSESLVVSAADEVVEVVLEAMKLLEDDILVQERGLLILSRFASQKSTDCLDMIMPVLNSMQRHDTSELIQERGVLSLLGIVSSVTAPSLVASGVIERILDAMEDHQANVDLHSLVCRFLGKLALSAENDSQVLLDMGSLDSIMASMRFFGSSATFQRSALFAVTSICRVKGDSVPGSISPMQRMEMCQCIFAAMKTFQTDVSIMKDGFQALTSLIEGRKGMDTKLIRESNDRIEKNLLNILAATASINPKVFYEACTFLWNLLGHDDEGMKNVLVDGNVVSSIAKGMKANATHHGLQLRAGAVVWNLVQTSPPLDECPNIETEDDVDSEKAKLLLQAIENVGICGCVIAPMKRHNGDSAALFRGCKLLITLVPIEEDLCKLVKSDVANVLFELLNEFPQHSGIQDHVSRLVEMFKRSGKIAISSPIENIFAALQKCKDGTSAQVNLCATLADLVDGGVDLGVYTSPTVKIILKAMQRQPSHVNLQNQGCRFQYALVQNAERSKEIMHDLGSLDVLIEAMRQHPKHEKIQEYVCRVLFYLISWKLSMGEGRDVKKFEQISQKVIDQNGAVLVVSAMKQHPQNVILAGCACSVLAMFSIVRGNAKILLKDLKAGEYVLRAMRRHSENAFLLRAAHKAIAKLCEYNRGDSEAMELMKEKGGLSSIIDGMRRHRDSEMVQFSGCEAIWTLCKMPDFQEPLLNAGALEAVLLAMRLFESSAEIQETGCAAFYHFYSRPGPFLSGFKAGIAGTIVQAMRNHPHDTSVQVSACSTLTTLLDKADDSMKVDLLNLGAADFIFLAMLRQKTDPSLQESYCLTLEALTPSSAAIKEPKNVKKIMQFTSKAVQILAGVARVHQESKGAIALSVAAMTKIIEASGQDSRQVLTTVESHILLIKSQSDDASVVSYSLKSLGKLVCSLGDLDPPSDLFEMVRAMEKQHPSSTEIQSDIKLVLDYLHQRQPKNEN